MIPIHAILTPEQDLLTFGTDERGKQGGEQIYALWEFDTEAKLTLENVTNTDIFCSVVMTLGDTGELLIAGGDARPLGHVNVGVRDMTAFDPVTREIYTHPAGQMEYARYYASGLTLPNGDGFIIGGADEHYVGAPHAEVYDPIIGTTLLDQSGVFDTLKDNFWWYPKAFVNSSGKVLTWFNYDRNAFWMSWEDDLAAESAGTLPFATDNSSPAILYDVDRVLTIDTFGKLWIVDIGGETLDAELVGKFSAAEGTRAWANMAVLPNGSVLITGGNDMPTEEESPGKFTQTASIWDPDTKVLTNLDAEDMPRLYHSTSILLPDGSVFSMGGGAPGPFTNLNAQRFNPDYLFDEDGEKADPIEITVAPTHAGAGDVFTFSVDRPKDVSRVTLIKHGAVTHSVDAETRFVDLDHFVRADGGIVARLPEQTGLLTPGAYMLFVLDENETPSVARSIRVDMAEHPDGDDFAHLILDDADLAAIFDETKLNVGDRSAVVTPYDARQDHGVASVSADGEAVTISGNAWKSVALRGQITADTVLRFDMSSSDLGELVAIGLDVDGLFDVGDLFVLGGSQKVASAAGSLPYLGAGETRSFEIAVGAHWTGPANRLVLVADDDADGSGAATFSNIRLTEGRELTVDGRQVSVRSFDFGQDFGTADVSADGASITVTGNGWKRVDHGAHIDEDTWLSFDVSSADTGEIMGIAIDGDNFATLDGIFQLGGSYRGSATNTTFRTYDAGDGTVRYDIPIGALLPEAEDELVFVMDDDADGSGTATFSNIVFRQGDKFLIDGTPTRINPHAPTQDEGVAIVADGGARLTLTGNAWKSAALSGPIAPGTWLSFDVVSDDVGELLGIGFDNDDGMNLSKIFQLGGNAIAPDVITDFMGYKAGDGLRHYTIRLDDYRLASPDRLVFVADDDADGSGTASFSNVRLITGPPVMVDGIATYALGHAGDQDQGLATSGDGGREVTLSGNAWKRLPVDVDITADTVLAFEIASEDLGELTAIGFAADDAASPGHLFRIGGTDAGDGLAGAALYDGGGDFMRIEIPVGQVYTGAFSNLVLVAEDDADGSGAAVFRDFEILTPATGLGSHGGAQDAGQARALATGEGVRLDGNAWKSVLLSRFEIDHDTVLHFEFRADVEGEVQGIGLDRDANLSEGSFWRLAGTQDWGRDDFVGSYDIGEGWKAYDIALGDMLSGAYDRIVLAADADAVGVDGDAYFRNITLEGVGAANELFEVL